MLELIGSNNFEKTKQLVAKMDMMNKKREEALNAQNNEVAQQIEQSKAATQEAKNNVEIYKADKDYQKAIDVESMRMNNNDRDGDNIPDDNSFKEAHDMTMDREKLSLDKAKERQNVKEGNQKIAESKAKVKQLNRQPVSNSN